MRKMILHFSDKGDFLIENEEGEVITLQELIVFRLMERGLKFPNPPAAVECLTEAWAEVNWKEIHDLGRKEIVLAIPVEFQGHSDPPYLGGNLDIYGGYRDDDNPYYLRLKLFPTSQLGQVGG